MDDRGPCFRLAECDERVLLGRLRHTRALHEVRVEVRRPIERQPVARGLEARCGDLDDLEHVGRVELERCRRADRAVAKRDPRVRDIGIELDEHVLDGLLRLHRRGSGLRSRRGRDVVLAVAVQAEREADHADDEPDAGDRVRRVELADRHRRQADRGECVGQPRLRLQAARAVAGVARRVLDEDRNRLAAPRGHGRAVAARDERLERRLDVVHRLEAIAGLLREQLRQDHLLERRRNLGAEQRRRCIADDPVEQLARIVIRRERPARGQHLVEDHAERVDIGAAIDVLGIGDLLGRHELRRPHHHALLLVVDGQEPRDAEVEHLDVIERVVLVGQEHVVGLEVAVNDACVVRGVQRRCDLRRDPDRAPHRQAAEPIDLVGEQRAFEELERDVRDMAVHEAHVRRLDDVRMPERAGRARLVHEPLDHVRIRRELGMEDLDRDLALDQRVLGQEHRAHPAFAQRADDPVAALDHVPGLHHRLARRSAHARLSSPPSEICTSKQVGISLWFSDDDVCFAPTDVVVEIALRCTGKTS